MASLSITHFWFWYIRCGLWWGQTLISLGLTALLQNKVKNVKIRLALNTLFFTISMGLIAYMLVPTGGQAFWTTYGTLALSEFIIMAISAPLMYYLDRS